MSQTTEENTLRAGRICTVVVVSGLLLLAVALVFGQTIGHPFVNYDDPLHISENPSLAHGLTATGIGWAFTTTHGNFWYPLTWLSMLLDFQICGFEPWGYHLTNVLLHGATTVLLFLVLWRMTADLWPSAFVAVVFAVHPLHVESVAWASQRKDVLSGLFWMLTLLAYGWYARCAGAGPLVAIAKFFTSAAATGRADLPSLIWYLLRTSVLYLLVVLLFVMGLMAKPVLVTLPFVLLLLDYWPLGRMDFRRVRACTHAGARPPLSTSRACKHAPYGLRWLVIEKLPLVLLAGAFCVATSLNEGEAVASLHGFPLSSRVANALVSYVAYVGQFFWPAGLAVFYPHPGSSLPIAKIVGAALLLTVVSVAALVWLRRLPYVFVGWFWYLGTLVPMIGLVQIGAYAKADRFTYVTQIGLCMALAWGAAELCRSWPRLRSACRLGSALVVGALLVFAWRQTTYWHDSESLWTHALACAPPNEMAHNCLGLALADRGQVDQAIAHYRRALEIQPLFADARLNLGNALRRQGEVDGAIIQFRRALKSTRDPARVWNNLGEAQTDRGQADEAIADFENALKIDPDFTKAHIGLGIALARQGQLDAAISHFQAALKVLPSSADAHADLANALGLQQRIDEAIVEYEKALKIQPDLAKVRCNLGVVLASRGRLDEAIAQFRKVLETEPDLVEARQYLELALFKREELLKALAARRESLRLTPNDVGLLNDTAWLLATNPNASVRNGTEAVELAQRAEQLSASREAAVLGTLAAAYAEAGRFPEAVQTAHKALERAAQQNKPRLAESLRAKIGLYESSTPYRESSRP